MRKRRGRKKTYIPLILAGFLVFYSMSMFLGTYIIKIKYEEEFEMSLTRTGQNIRMRVEDFLKTGNYTEKACENYMWMVLSLLPYEGQSKFQQIAGAVYDQDGELVAATANTTGTGVTSAGQYGNLDYCYYDLQEYLSAEEIKELAKYRLENHQALKNNEKLPYNMSTAVVFHGQEDILCKITVYSGEDSDTGEYLVHEDGSYDLDEWEIVWQWENPEMEQGEDRESKIISWGEAIHFPYLEYGWKAWKEWMEDPYLQGFPKKTENLFLNDNSSAKTDRNDWEDASFPIYLGDLKESNMEIYTLHLRSRGHPWLAAIEDMKYVYVYMFLLAAICMIKIIGVTEKTYKKQEALEEMRRDFLNAAAHELKTPLGIIRGFAENLKENTIEDKRDYYLDRIIDQTEEMDELIREMLYSSRLDSASLHLKKEPINLMDIAKEQIEKQKMQIQEKKISVRYKDEGEFIVYGDAGYLEKAVWNLISNSISYNKENGWILITAKREQFSIENSGPPIDPEKISNLFEMFGSGEKGRSAKEKHFGIGLYLTKKIFSLHHLEISLENTEEGVKVNIS